MEDADEKATLIPQAPDRPAAAAGERIQPYSPNGDSLKRYLQEVREISHETSNAKVVEWISVPCAVAATLAPLLVAMTDPSTPRHKLFRTLQTLTGIETFAGFGIPPIIVLWNLYANENETVSSPVVTARDRRAIRGVIGCQVLLALCLVAAAAVNLRTTHGAAEGITHFPHVQKGAFLIAACELAGAFVFIVLGVYKWIIAKTISSLSLRVDAITCFATVYLNVITGCAHFYDALALSKSGVFTPASKETSDTLASVSDVFPTIAETPWRQLILQALAVSVLFDSFNRVRYFEFFSLAAAVFLLGAAVYHLRAAVHIPRPI